MFVLAALCLLAGVLPGFVIDALTPLSQALVDGRMPAQARVAWLAIVPISESRSSYDGLLIFLFIAIAALMTASAIHRLASRALRRAPAWDCGFPDASPLTQYSATSFAQPIRRVFGTVVFRAGERVTMPPPGDMAAAALSVTLRDVIWDGIYAPLARGVSVAADRLNGLQFLTIRRYLSIVFVLLILLLLVLAVWL
jgi:hydrogenase-4 component B